MGLKATQFESALEAVPDALVGMDQKGAIRFVNHQTEVLFGHDREQLIGQHISVLVPEALWQVYSEFRDDLFADSQSRSAGVELELSGRHHEGGEFPINVRLSPIDTGDVLLAITRVGDVARHKHAVAKAELLDAIDRYSGDAIVGADLNGIITSWNPAAERMYGYSSQEALGADASLLVPEDRAGDEGALVAKIKDGVAVEHFETMLVRKDGTVVPVSLSVAPVRDEDGAVVGATAVHREVTAAREKSQAAQRLAAIVESSDDAVIGKTLDGIVTSWNAAATRMYGYSGQEMVGKPIELLIPKDRPGEIKDILAKVRAGQRVEHFESERVRNDGTVFPVSLTVSPICDPEGAVVGASTIARDVTELRQALARAQDVIEGAPDALVGVDQTGVIQFVNRQAELSFGYDRDELVGQLVETLVPESSRAVHPGHRGRYGADPVARPMGAGLELTGRRRDGTQFPADISLSSVQTMDGLLVTAAVRDVTDQRRAFEAAQRLAAIVESTDDAIIGTTLEGIVTSWNAAAERMLGYSSAEIIGKPDSLLNGPNRAEARPAARAKIAAGQHVDRFETMVTRKDGTRFPASCTLSGIRGADGRVVGVSMVARDLSEQVQKDRALAEVSRQYRLLAENASDLVVWTSPDRVITWVSPSLTRTLGWAVEDLMGKRLLDLVHPDDADATAGQREALYSGGEVSTPAGGFLMRFRTKNGLYRWMAGVATPVSDESGVLTGVVSGLRDVDDLVQAREEAQAERATLRATLDSLMDPHVLFEAVRDERGQIVDFRFTDANPAACAYDGIAYQDLVGSRMLEHFPGVVGAGLLQQYAEVVETGEPIRVDEVVYMMGGEDRYLDIRAVRVGDGLSYSWRDVTDRHVAAARLAKSEERYRLLAQNSSDVVMYSREGVFQWVSPSLTRALGWDPQDWVGHRFEDFTYPEDVDVVAQRRAEVTAGGHPDLVLRMLAADGTPHWVHLTAGPLLNDEGSTVGIVASIRVIDEQVTAQRALAASEERYRLLAENAADVVALSGPDRRAVWVSPSVTRILGWAPEELVGTLLSDLVHPDDKNATATARDTLFAGQQATSPGGFEMRMRRKSGDYRWVSVLATPVTDESGAPAGVVGSFRDVEALVHTREVVETDRATLRATLDSMLDPHILLEAVRDESGQVVDFVYLDANPAACAYNRTPYEELVGTRLLELFPGQAGAGLLDQYAHVIETGEPLVLDDFVYPQELMGGEERHYDIRAARISEDGLSYTWRDVTDRHEAAAYGSRMAAVVEQTHDAIIGVSVPDALVTSWNRAAERMYGYTAEEIIGKPGFILTPKNLLEQSEGLVTQVRAGESVTDLETVRVRKDGTEIPVSVSSSPIRDANGVTVGLSAIHRDITKEKEAREEAQALTEALKSSNDSLRDFVAVASHDLRSPLVTIGGFTKILTDNWATLSDEDRLKQLGAIGRGVDRLSRLTNDLLTSAKVEAEAEQAQPKNIRLATALASYLEANREELGAVAVTCPPELVAVVDPSHLIRILDNYLTNAFKYGEPPISIEAERVGDVVELRVRDHGPGVPPEFVSRLFTKFDRGVTPTTRAKQGTGLGLSIVKALAEANHGDVGYQQGEPRGGCFVVRLPAAAS